MSTRQVFQSNLRPELILKRTQHFTFAGSLKKTKQMGYVLPYTLAIHLEELHDERIIISLTLWQIILSPSKCPILYSNVMWTIFHSVRYKKPILNTFFVEFQHSLMYWFLNSKVQHEKASTTTFFFPQKQNFRSDLPYAELFDYNRHFNHLTSQKDKPQTIIWFASLITCNWWYLYCIKASETLC